MKGTPSLDNDEIRRVSRCFTGTFEARNRGLFMIEEQEGDRRDEQADGTRHAQRGVYGCRLERKTRDTCTAEILCPARL